MTEQNKARLIASELYDFCANHGAKEFQIHIKLEHEMTTIEAAGNIRISQSELDEVLAILNKGRLREIENSFVELLGERASDNDLEFLSAFVDTAEAFMEPTGLRIRVTRVTGRSK